MSERWMVEYDQHQGWFLHRADGAIVQVMDWPERSYRHEDVTRLFAAELEADHDAARVLADAVAALADIRSLGSEYEERSDKAGRLTDIARDFFATHPDLTAEGGGGTMISPWYTVWCDAEGCADWQEHGGHTRKEAWDQAKKRGWKRVNGKHYCPDHAAPMPKGDQDGGER